MLSVSWVWLCEMVLSWTGEGCMCWILKSWFKLFDLKRLHGTSFTFSLPAFHLLFFSPVMLITLFLAPRLLFFFFTLWNSHFIHSVIWARRMNYASFFSSLSAQLFQSALSNTVWDCVTTPWRQSGKMWCDTEFNRVVCCHSHSSLTPFLFFFLLFSLVYTECSFYACLCAVTGVG